MFNLFRSLEKWARLHKRNRIIRGFALTLSCIVIFTTTYALILPAITVDEEAAEGLPGFYLEDPGEEQIENEQGNAAGAPEEGALEVLPSSASSEEEILLI